MAVASARHLSAAKRRVRLSKISNQQPRIYAATVQYSLACALFWKVIGLRASAVLFIQLSSGPSHCSGLGNILDLFGESILILLQLCSSDLHRRVTSSTGLDLAVGDDEVGLVADLAAWAFGSTSTGTKEQVGTFH